MPEEDIIVSANYRRVLQEVFEGCTHRDPAARWDPLRIATALEGALQSAADSGSGGGSGGGP